MDSAIPTDDALRLARVRRLLGHVLVLLDAVPTAGIAAAHIDHALALIEQVSDAPVGLGEE